MEKRDRARLVHTIEKQPGTPLARGWLKRLVEWGRGSGKRQDFARAKRAFKRFRSPG